MTITINGSGTITGISAGGLPDATIQQADLATNVAGNGPAFSAYPSATQSLSTGTITKIQFNTEDFDTNSNYDKDTNYRFLPTVAGYYQVSLVCATSAAVGVQAAIFKNGSAYAYGTYAAASNWSNGSAIVYMNGSTDYVEGYLFVATAATTQAVASSKFQASMVRAA
jgi:hypothetical protein